MAKQNLNTTDNMANMKAREIDFVGVFNQNWKALLELLGITRAIKKAPGTRLTAVKAKLTLAESVGEGEEIPYSKVEYETVSFKDLEVQKYAKATSVEAVAKYGAELAIEKTDEEFRNELQGLVFNDLLEFIQTGTLVSTEATFQLAIAMAQATVIDRFKKMRREATGIVTFVNTLDAYRYLGLADVTVQNAFGIQYVKNFLGVDTLILSSDIPSGKVIATPKNNIDLYYIDPNDSDFAKLGLTFTVQGETNLIGFHAEGNYRTAVGEAFALMGMALFAEYMDGIAVVTVDNTPFAGPTVSASNPSTEYWGHLTSDLQENVAVSGNAITGHLKYVSEGALARDWGPGNFIALKFTPAGGDTAATTYQVGIIPSEGAGMQTLDSDMDAVLKVTNRNAQRIVVITSDGAGHETTQSYTLSGLTVDRS